MPIIKQITITCDYCQVINTIGQTLITILNAYLTY